MTQNHANEPELPSSAPRNPETLSEFVAELAAAPPQELSQAWASLVRPGQRIDRFEILRELGRGGFGIVFEAKDLELGRGVAFKAIRPGYDDQDRRRIRSLQDEAQIVSKLQHANLITLYDWRRSEHGPYLIFELLEGETLANRLHRGPLEPEEAAEVAISVGRALAHAHERGVIHRDLKPSNVFLCKDGQAKVLDFGLARVFGTSGPARGGTPGYMAPEQLEGKDEDFRTDVYAAGVLLDEMLGRQPPRRARALATVASRARSRNPADRFPDAASLVDALARARERIERRRRRPLMMAGAVLVAAVLAWIFIPPRPPHQAGVLVAVADASNETGEAALDFTGSTLAGALEQSPRIRVVPRATFADLVTVASTRKDTVRPECRAARAAAAERLLLLGLRRSGGAYTVTLQAFDEACDPLFSRLETAADTAGVFAAVERLAASVRIEFREPRKAAEEKVVPYTANPEAFRLYVLGEQCSDRPVYGHDCAEPFRKAVRLDPGFAAAHYKIAEWNTFNGNRDEQRDAMRIAHDLAASAPEKVRFWIEALDAFRAGRRDAAIATYEEAWRRWPQDLNAPYQIGDIYRHDDDFRKALPWFERCVEADPEHGWANAHLVEALGATGQLESLRLRAEVWKDSPRPRLLHALSQAYGWLGQVPAAARAAQRGLDAGGELTAVQDLMVATIILGDYAPVEDKLKGMKASGSEVRATGYYAQAALDAYQGRTRAGLKELDALVAAMPEHAHDANYVGLRLDYLMAYGSAGALRTDLDTLRSFAPSDAASFAASLAWLGDVAGAEELAKGIQPGSPRAEIARAVIAVRRGEPGALDRLGGLVVKAPISVWRIAPLFLYADLAEEAGRLEDAAAAHRRLQSLYAARTMWRAWAFPRSLLALARIEAKLGRPAVARPLLDRLLAAFARAEPDHPVLLEARTLRARL